MTETAAIIDPRKKSKRRQLRREYLVFIALVLPNVALLAVFAFWPVVNNVWLSLTSWNFLAPAPTFIGLGNYTKLFTDPKFYQVLGTTAIFTGAIVIASMVIGLGVAVLLNRKLFGRDLVRTLVFAPHILPGAAVAMVWLLIFDPNYGLTRVFFNALGTDSPAWMTDPAWALPGIIVVYVWRNLGFCAIIYLSAMQSLPSEVYEAASLDGASAWRKFRNLTIPLLSPTTFFLLIIQIIGTFQAFDIIAVMTGGGPARATTTLSWFVYQEGFKSFNIGFAAAGAVLMFVILIIVTIAQTLSVGRKVHYQ